MSAKNDFVWVICPDNHTEGLGAPLQAFLVEADAQAAMTLLTKPLAAPAMRMCKVPLWPNVFDVIGPAAQ